MLPALGKSPGALQHAVAAGCTALAACTQHRLLHSAAGSAAAGGSEQQAKRPYTTPAEATAPTTLPQLARELGAERPARTLCLSSINDPANFGLAASPQGTGEPAYYWLGNSLSEPKEHVAPASPRTGAPRPLPGHGFRTATSKPTQQRVVFRSSMADPEVYLRFRSSMADPPLPPLSGPAGGGRS